MTDQPTHDQEPQDIASDVDGDQVNVEAVNDGEAVPGTQPGAAPAAGSPAGARTDDATDAGDPEAELAEAETADAVLAAERLADLQRLQAEYVNYKRRVDRDRVTLKDLAVAEVLESLLPTLDEIHLAREHGDLADGPFRSIADKLETALGRYGLSTFGAKGEAFDPVRHEALMHAPWPADDAELPADASGTTVVTVLQPGYAVGERVLRAARVAVADPE